MVNKCPVTNCTSGYSAGLKKPSFHFPEDEELRKKWIYFINRKEWIPTKYSVICIEHLESKFVKFGKICKLIWELHPVPTIHNDSISRPSLLRTPDLVHKSPRKRKIDIDELEEFQEKDKVINFEAFNEKYSPVNFSFRRLEKSVQYYCLVFDPENGVPKVNECISVDKNLHARLTYQGLPIPLPDWLRIGHNCIVNKFSMLENLSSHIKNRSNLCSTILQELNSIQHYKPQG